jgi:flagellar motor switch protein FliN/FliY
MLSLLYQSAIREKEFFLREKREGRTTVLRMPEDRGESLQEKDARTIGLRPMLRELTDLELPLALALGQTTLPIQDILKIMPGSLIELDRNVGDYVDLTVHGTIVARGEIVSVQGNYGVRIKQIISREERLALHGLR